MKEDYTTAPHPNDTGLAQMAALMSDQTCGEACWHAREDICRCSCGGLNHGCLKDKNGKTPARSAKIDGFPYVLKAVGRRELYSEAFHLNSPEVVGYKGIIKVSDDLTYHYTWKETEPGAPARVKPASKAQKAGWRELTAYKDDKVWEYVYLLWVRVNSLKEAAQMESSIKL
jgi:hypothetical protein